MALEPAVPLTKEPMMPFAEESPAEDSPLEVSVIMPCLNEADTLEDCIAKARKALHEHDIRGEIIVADNGSTDASPGIARRMGARVVHVEAKGYGNCGMRGFTKGFYNRLNLRCTGMEFATEMIIKASLFRESMAEVPITLHKDGRKTHAPHLKTFRDGWRTLRFFLMYSPRWLFVGPGALLILLGLLGYSIAMPRTELWGVTFDAHTLLFASLAILCGYQSILFALFTKTFAIGEGHLCLRIPLRCVSSESRVLREESL
jgi:Glycosyl transferase family 2